MNFWGWNATPKGELVLEEASQLVTCSKACCNCPAFRWIALQGGRACLSQSVCLSAQQPQKSSLGSDPCVQSLSLVAQCFQICSVQPKNQSQSQTPASNDSISLSQKRDFIFCFKSVLVTRVLQKSFYQLFFIPTPWHNDTGLT